jgi:hypothetical protein
MADPRPTSYSLALDVDAQLTVMFTALPGEGVERYSVVLAAESGGEWQAVRVWDNAHGQHDMHRYSGSTKEDAVVAHHASPTEAMRDAIAQAKSAYRRMIDAWKP